MAEMERKVSDDTEIYEVDNTEVPTMKEYEKLLNNDANRKLNVKAIKMVKLGLFEQKSVPSIDFGQLSKVTYKKPYKGMFNLYIAQDGQLLYIHEKTESETGRAYEYDVLFIEKVTEEEYDLILEASVHEKENFIKFSMWFSVILFLVSIVLFVAIFVYYIIAGAELADILALNSNGILYLGMLSALVTLSSISYRKFTSKK